MPKRGKFEGQRMLFPDAKPVPRKETEDGIVELATVREFKDDVGHRLYLIRCPDSRRSEYSPQLSGAIVVQRMEKQDLVPVIGEFLEQVVGLLLPTDGERVIALGRIEKGSATAACLEGGRWVCPRRVSVMPTYLRINDVFMCYSSRKRRKPYAGDTRPIW